MTDSESPAQTVRPTDRVELTVPADAAYVSVLRTVMASLAARRDFTIEEIDDLRIAVDEASSLLLPHAGPASVLTACFDGGEDSLTVRVSISATVVGADTPSDAAVGGGEVDETSFAWMVLAAVADDVRTERLGDDIAMVLAKTRSARIS